MNIIQQSEYNQNLQSSHLPGETVYAWFVRFRESLRSTKFLDHACHCSLRHGLSSSPEQLENSTFEAQPAISATTYNTVNSVCAHTQVQACSGRRKSRRNPVAEHIKKNALRSL